MTHRIRPCLWFDNNLEDALEFYQGIFPEFEVTERSLMPPTTMDESGTMVIASFKLNGREFTAFNGGPHFKFSEAISFEIEVETQEEVDYYWNRLSEGGEVMQCGWLKDPFGVAWQVVPKVLFELATDSDRERASRAMNAMLEMEKIDIAVMVAAADNGS